MHGRVASHTRAIRALCAGAVAMLLATAAHAQSDVSIDVSAFGALRLADLRGKPFIDTRGVLR